MSNEIKITPILPQFIAYSMFVLIVAWAFDFNHQNKVTEIINVLKENWVLLTTETKELILEKFKLEVVYANTCPDYHKILTEFITWANQNRDNCQ